MLALLPGEMELRSLQELLDCLFWLQAPWCVGDVTTAAVAASNGRENLAGFWGQDKKTSLKCQVPLMGVGGIKTSQLNGISCFFFVVVVVPQKYKIQGKPCLVPEELGKYRPGRVVVL